MSFTHNKTKQNIYGLKVTYRFFRPHERWYQTEAEREKDMESLREQLSVASLRKI